MGTHFVNADGTSKSLSGAELSALFPFCFEISRSLKITALGPRWKSFAPEIAVGDDLFKHFTIERPLGCMNAATICASREEIFLLHVHGKPGFTLRGQILSLDDGDRILFVGGPWIIHVDDLVVHALGLSDFPPHDPRGDLLVLLQTRETTLGDLKLLASRLRETAKRLDDRNKQLEEQIVVRDNLEAQLRQSQKVQAVGRLAGGVAHDFNNILMAISGYASLASTHLEEGDQVRHWVDQIRAAADRATGLTQQLLAFSRQKVIQPAAIDPAVEVQTIERILHPLIGENIHFIVTANAGLGMVWMDPSSLHQIMMNLVINARDSMPTGGDLSVIVSEAPRENGFEAISITEPTQPDREAATATSWLTIEVIDSGTGMDERTKANIFDPFFTTKDIGKGSGLGLSTVYGLVQQGGGEIEVESALGKGSRFLVKLPKLVAPSAEKVVVTVAAQSDGERVLLVEDEEMVRNLVEQVLTRAGYVVVSTENPHEAINIVASSPRFDLLVSDVVMSGMTGLDMARQIEKLSPGICTIFMSGFTKDPSLRAGMILPTQRYLTKPFQPDTLIAVAGSLLASRK
ncbi:MAG: response regulator [Akkermansiaceae bacterium]|nr:response regulator [Akkermansiaceae bacterium]